MVGVISPWNYPFQLGMLPAVGALAAGNRVMLKPSELTPSFSSLLREIVAEFFSPEEFAVVVGDVEVGRAFSQLPFDHLFFTGSTTVGRADRARGGREPDAGDAGARRQVAGHRRRRLRPRRGGAAHRLRQAAERRADLRGAGLPAGAARRASTSSVAAITRAATAMYPSFAANPDYTSIVSDRHCQRLARLVAEAEAGGAKAIRIDPAGEGARESGRKFLPTLLTGVGDDMAVMREEIFGPVLPVVPYDTLDEAIAYVNRHPRPLALYWFGRSAANRDRVLRSTLSGGVTINDVCWHVAQENLPFGGVGASGSGAYHGEQSFRTFSKDKPVLHQARINGFGLFRPPYGRHFDTAIALLKRLF